MLRILYVFTSLLLIGNGATQWWHVTNYDGNGEPPAFWWDYVFKCLLPFVVGAGMIAWQETYTFDDFFDHLEQIVARVPWPRWSTLALLGLAALFALWSYGWAAYNTFTGVVAATLFLSAAVSSLHRAAKRRREKRIRSRLARRRDELKLPWTNPLG
jgi:hypothetical protein